MTAGFSCTNVLILTEDKYFYFKVDLYILLIILVYFSLSVLSNVTITLQLVLEIFFHYCTGYFTEVKVWVHLLPLCGWRPQQVGQVMRTWPLSQTVGKGPPPLVYRPPVWKQIKPLQVSPSRGLGSFPASVWLFLFFLVVFLTELCDIQTQIINTQPRQRLCPGVWEVRGSCSVIQLREQLEKPQNQFRWLGFRDGLNLSSSLKNQQNIKKMNKKYRNKTWRHVFTYCNTCM